jgi:hypothetical protein
MTINKHSIEFDFITDEEEILTFPRISKAENSGEGIQVIFTMSGFFFILVENEAGVGHIPQNLRLELVLLLYTQRKPLPPFTRSV